MAGHIEIAVRGYFTSDTLGANVAPRITLRSSDIGKMSNFIKGCAEGMSAGPDLPAFLRKVMGDDFGVTDWRPMTDEEIKEHNEDSDAD